MAISTYTTRATAALSRLNPTNYFRKPKEKESSTVGGILWKRLMKAVDSPAYDYIEVALKVGIVAIAIFQLYTIIAFATTTAFLLATGGTLLAAYAILRQLKQCSNQER